MRWYLDWGNFRAWKRFSKILVNRWSLLFQKVDLAGVFAFFSVLSVSRSQFWSYDHENGIKLILGTFGTNVSSRFLIEGLKIFFETFKVALQCHFLMFGCQNESKTASEISKIHFWGQKIKFSFWLNKCFWNVLQLVKHIQESYFYIFKVVTHSEIYLCRQHKAKNGWKPTSEISKIHFWGRKIKFSFWLNECFWNVLELIKHIQEGYFYIFKVVTHSQSYLCTQHKAKKWQKTDLRNFENPFLRSKNQIFFLTQ